MIDLRIADESQMAAAAKGFSQTGNSAGAKISHTIREIDGLGGCWGGDPAGQAFWAAYRTAATTAAANASQVGPQIQALGDNTLATLDMYRDNEASGAALSGGIGA